MSSLYYGSENSIDEYLDRVNKMHRAPTMIQDFPEAPRASSHPEKHKDHNRVKIFHEIHQHHDQAPEVHKKVHFTESEKYDEVERRGKHQVYEERTIDMEADGFIQKRHKNFDSCNTFKGY